MKKKRVLALFLAFSMVLSSNCFTALAAENDSAVAVEADSSDKTGGETVSEESSEIGNGSNASEDGDKTEDGSDVYDENGGTETENGSSDESDATGNVSDASGESGETGNESEVPGEDDETVIDESEETDAAESEVEEDIDEADSIEEAAPSDNAEISVPLMRTFTDETGMVVTYNANEEASYKYYVTDGVLEKVKKVVKGENGENKEEDLSGVVELKQQEGTDKYHTIATSVFQGNTGIEYVILPNNVTIIKENAFSGCTALRGISLPTGITDIEEGTFEGCTNLTQLSIPKSVETIGKNAFKGDTSLFMVYIKDSAYCEMLEIGESAFQGCRRLEKFGSDTEFILPGNLRFIGASAFQDCYAIKAITLPDSVVDWEEDDSDNDGEVIIKHSLGESVFKNCTSLTDVTLSGEEIIPKHAFEGCTNLLSVKFASGNRTIDEYAFANCSRLAEVVFSYTVTSICDYAFSGCSQLRYVEFPNAEATIGNKDAFPNNNGFLLWMRGFAYTAVYRYANEHNNMRFIAYDSTTDEYFQYTYRCLTDEAGTVTFSRSDKTTDPNKANSAKGVKAGEKIYVSVNTKSSVKLVAGSLRCNGTPISGPDSEGYYVFNMPVGGAYVTAEFESTGSDKNKWIDGSAADVKYELSNGSELKVGQTSRMFLIDISAEAGNSVIPSYKIEFSSTDKTVASVSSDGTIKALKRGTAYITAIVYDREGNVVRRQVTIQVEEADVYSLKLKPYGYDRNIVTIDEDDHGYGRVTLKKEDVETNETTFTLLATAYDSVDSSGDNMSVALKWSTSDSKVAKLAATSTKDTESQNTITIPKGASGEATITVTATNTNPEEADNKTVTSKFAVRVIDRTPRLSASTVTLNPYRTDGVDIEIIGAYLDDNSYMNIDNVKLFKQDDKNVEYNEFIINDGYNGEEGNNQNFAHKFNITSTAANLKDGNYQAYVFVIVDDNPYYLPLTIKVKSSAPNPKVKFASNQSKMNFFYSDGGIEDGVKPVISNLGNDVVSEYDLENLSNSGDNAWFNKNFYVDDEGIIRRSDEPMHYTSKNKPVVTGYLVLRFNNYKEGFNEKKFKVTIPYKTVKPSYKLERTSDTFNASEGVQPVTLAVVDKKTKKPVDLSDCNISVLPSSTTTAVSNKEEERYIDENGIQMFVNPSRGAGKVVLSITNENEWDQDLQFTYSVKVSNKNTTFKLSKSTVTLNKYYAGEQKVQLTLKSNQYGIKPADVSFETPDLDKLSDSKAEQYGYINVNWIEREEEQFVEVSLDGDPEDIKTGSYKFTYYPYGVGGGNKVTLTVKVTAAAPKLSIKGSAKLNRLVGEQDVASLEVNIKNLPSGSDCRLLDSSAIEYVTNKEDDMGLEDEFIWSWEDVGDKQILHVSLGNEDLASKTYTFKLTPEYDGCSIPEDKVKPIKFKVTVYSKTVSISLKAKGKINLLERYDETYPGINSGTETYSDASLVTESATVEKASVNSINALNYNVIETSHDTLATYTGEVPNFEYAEELYADTDDGEEADTIPVKYDFNGEQVTLKLKVDSGSGSEVGSITENEDDSDTETEIESNSDSGFITLEKDNSYPDADYIFTATAKEGFVIKSINAYDNNKELGDAGVEGYEDDEEDEWSSDDIFVSGDTKDNGKTGTLTIGKDTDMTDVSEEGITIVVKSEAEEPSTEDPSVPEPEEPKTFNVTLPELVGGVDSIEIALLDIDDELDDAEYVDIADLEDDLDLPISGNVIKVNEEQRLALRITLVDGYSMTLAANDVKVDVNSSYGNVYEYVLEGKDLEEYTVLKIETEDNGQEEIQGQEVTFVRNGDHAIIYNAEDEKIEDDTDTTIDDDDYEFSVEIKDGYAVDVVAYLTSEYDKNPSEANPILEKSRQDSEKRKKYSISSDDITEPITVVVTDVYTVTIETDEGDDSGIISDLDYRDDGKPTVEHDGSMSVQFKVDKEALGSNKAIIVKVTMGDNPASTIEPDSVTDAGDEKQLYTYDIKNIIDNTVINISIVTTYTVTLTDEEYNPEEVYVLEYAVVDDEAAIENIESFNKYDAQKGMPIVSGKTLVLKINTIGSNYEVKAVKHSDQEIKPKEYDSNYYYVIKNISSDATISIEIEVVYIITFVQNGTHASFAVDVSSGESGAIQKIDDNNYKVSENTDYEFTVDVDADYAVDVKAYTTESYNTQERQSVVVNEPDSPDDNTYTITEDVIKESGNITIVVTDIYAVTIEDSTLVGDAPQTSCIESLSYWIGSTTGEPSIYEESNPAAVPWNENLYITFELTESATGKKIVVFDENNNKLEEADNSTPEKPVYFINSVEDNMTLTINVVYEISEEITTDSKGNTATIGYDDTKVISDKYGNIIFPGDDLTFTVEAKEGYIVKEVSYKLASGNNSTEPLTPDSNSDEDKGLYKYTIENADIDSNITIIVTTAWENADQCTVKFDVAAGAKVSVISVNGEAVEEEPEQVKIDINGENKTVTFSVTLEDGYKLDYVGTDEKGQVNELKPADGIYTFTLPEIPDAIMTIYIKAALEQKDTDIKLNFAGLTDGSNETAEVNIVSIEELGEGEVKITNETKVPPTGVVDAAYKKGDKIYFTVEPKAGYTLSNPAVSTNAGAITSKEYTVTGETEAESGKVTIYILDLADVETNVTVTVNATSSSQGDSGTEYPDEPEKPELPYNLKNSIVYTPVITGVNDKVMNAKIYDANGRNPDYDDEESVYFSIDVDQDTGLIYVMPKEDLDDEETYLKNKTTYQVKIWVELENYHPSDGQGGVEEGFWVNQTLKIKTAQVLPKVVIDTKTPLNLYQSNTNYTASFVVTLKEGSVGEIEGIEFGENDTKAIDSFELESDVSDDGSVMLVTLSLNGSPQYAVNSTNKIKMYVKFKNQAKGTTGTPITMTVKINR